MADCHRQARPWHAVARPRPRAQDVAPVPLIRCRPTAARCATPLGRASQRGAHRQPTGRTGRPQRRLCSVQGRRGGRRRGPRAPSSAASTPTGGSVHLPSHSGGASDGPVDNARRGGDKLNDRQARQVCRFSRPSARRAQASWSLAEESQASCAQGRERGRSCIPTPPFAYAHAPLSARSLFPQRTRSSSTARVARRLGSQARCCAWRSRRRSNHQGGRGCGGTFHQLWRAGSQFFHALIPRTAALRAAFFVLATFLMHPSTALKMAPRLGVSCKLFRGASHTLANRF